MTNYTFQSLFDFTRTTSGTFVGSNGLIQTTPASVNLLLQTQAFDNGFYLQDDISIVANSTTAPDGTTTADTISDTATNSDHRVIANNSFTTVSGQSYTLSFFIKNLNRNFAQIAFATSGFSSTAYANFDLSTGVLGTVGAGTTATITAAGNGWYRCSITATASSSALTGLFVSLITSATAVRAELYAGTGQSIFLWGAQLEAAATATTYTRNNGGVYPARFDYDPATLLPKGILIEEQRTNLVLQSEAFGTTWTTLTATVSSNAVVAPDGVLSADKIIPDNAASLGSSGVTQTVTAAAATYTYSVYAKIGEYNRVRLLVRDSASAANNASVIVSLVDGTITTAAAAAGTFTGASATVIAAGNGFYRVSLTLTSTGASSLLARAFVDDSVATTGNGTSGIFLWGAQLELGAFATSYIPTVASQVTRTADQCTIVAPMFAPWYNQTQGTLLAEGTIFGLNVTAASGIAALSNGTSAENTAMFRSGGANNLTGEMRDGGVTQATFTTPLGSQPFKVALAYATNNTNLAQNGTVQTADTVCTTPTVDRLVIGAVYSAGDFPTNGHIRSIQFYPVRLADFQLQALTA